MKTKSGGVVNSRSKGQIASVSKRLISVFSQRLESLEGKRDEFRELISEFHRLDAPEEDKLKQKDKDLVNLIARVDQAVRAQFQKGNITKPEALLFLATLNIFDQVESILWELKELPGDPPTPDPLPEPKPSPSPKPGSSRNPT